MKLPFIRALLAVPVAAAILVAGAGPSIADGDGGGGPGDIPKVTFGHCYAVIVHTPNPEDPEVEVCPPTG